MDAARTRLLDLAASRRVSLAQLSRLIGKNASYLQQFVRKGSPRKLEENDRAALAQFFGVAEAELGAPPDKSHANGASAMPAKWTQIPRLRLQASAGPGADVEAEEPIGSMCFSPAWLREQGLQGRSLSAIAVRGDSMEPTLREGDEILVDATPRSLRDGIYVVRLDGALLVKRLETRHADRLTLLSDNGAYKPIICAPQDVEVIGRVVWKGGRL